MISRRVFLGTGLAALAGALTRRARASRFPPPPCLETGALGLVRSNPIRDVTDLQSVTVGGFRFAPNWYGDWFGNNEIPFHRPENQFPGGEPPAPSEHADVVIVGGGLSGLASAYLLRRHRPVLLELHDRFGGYSQGEQWEGTSYSLGGAYFMAPDEGSFLETFYRELGLDHLVRESFGNTDDPFEIEGRYVAPADFWSGLQVPEGEREAFRQYAALVLSFTETYPDIPLDPSLDNQWIRDLDRLTLEQHIRQSLTVPVPNQLAAAVQGYCYSSFGAGWHEISAACGWNFIAAEEWGRWVLPGGNAGLAGAMWERLRPLEARTRPGCPARHLRAGCRVVDVRVRGRDDVRVTYKGRDGNYRAISAKRVVLACPKHVCRQIVHQWAELAPDQENATHRIDTAPYVVANVLLDARLPRDFYDLFLLGDGSLATAPGEEVQVTDALNGRFARRANFPKSVLTLYWPRPFATARFSLIDENGWNTYAQALAAQLPGILSVLGINGAAVRQVRMARWGHAMPIARPGLIADGVWEALRTPLRDHVFFVSQENWALPAVETCLLEAEAMRPLIEHGL